MDGTLDRQRPSTPNAGRTRQTLLFDADDTLWENNIYFERAITGFVDLVAHPRLSPAEVRDCFNCMESTRVQAHGYGTRSFRKSMSACFADLARRDPYPEEHAHMDALARSIVESPIHLLPHVLPTLLSLAKRHRLVLVTKGDKEEQLDKLDRSGLSSLFSAAEVVPEKHRGIYADLESRYRLNAAHTWMIGNSPKSDINPALAAGLHTVYLPHHSTWILEREALMDAPPGRHRVTLNSFDQLLDLF